MPIGEGGRREQQTGVGAQQGHPPHGQHGGGGARHRRPPLDAQQVPDQREHDDQDQHQGKGGHTFGIGPDHQGDGADQTQQARRMVAGPTQYTEALAGGEGHHDQTQHQRGHRSQLEGQQRHHGHGDAGATRMPIELPAAHSAPGLGSRSAPAPVGLPRSACRRPLPSRRPGAGRGRSAQGAAQRLLRNRRRLFRLVGRGPGQRRSPGRFGPGPPRPAPRCGRRRPARRHPPASGRHRERR